MFGIPTFRWLPAKSKTETRFLLFYAKMPDGFTKIGDVKLWDGKLTIVDRSGKILISMPRTNCESHSDPPIGRLNSFLASVFVR